ncbi:MAG: sortase family protein [Frankiales bacterium]|nr:sortase family protein [Frankiales bacterium]
MSDVIRTALRGVGQTLMTLGVVVLLFCVYELYVTGLVTAREQTRLGDDLRQTWAEPAARPQPGEPELVSRDLGEGIAILHIPSLAGYDPWVVVEGTSVADLKNGPGHIPGTALPGEVGNVVVSGHRTTYGAPFQRLDELTDGSQIVLETRDGWFTYDVRRKQIVAPAASEVTLPVPGNPTATPVDRLLTLTTCHPKYSAKQRLIVFAELTASSKKSDGLPDALKG